MVHILVHFAVTMFEHVWYPEGCVNLLRDRQHMKHRVDLTTVAVFRQPVFDSGWQCQTLGVFCLL